MAKVSQPLVPEKCDPFGSGVAFVPDVLSPWNYKDTDPFILMHEVGPQVKGKGKGRPSAPPGRHPHRGFSEVPYLKQGSVQWVYYWDPWGDHHPPMESGAIQWGSIGSGIEHGGFNPGTYEGVSHTFMLWVNLPKEEKLAPPCFQDTLPEALQWRTLSEKVKYKTLVGAESPIDSGNVAVNYYDYELTSGGAAVHDIPPKFETAFLYVYSGKGTFGSSRQSAKRGEVMKVLDPAGQQLAFAADEHDELKFLLVMGVPLREPIVQHGPFVMTTQEQIREAFSSYQRGELCSPSCEFVLHTASGSERSALQAPRR